MLRCLSRLATVALGGALAVAGGLAPAQADDLVTIRGAGFPETRTAQLSLVGCGSLYERTEEVLAPRIGRGPGTPPMGERSLSYDLAGGNAVGSLHYVDSMAATTSAALSVYSVSGGEGVAYAGFQDRSDAGTTRLWIGRAPLSAPPGAWARIEATALTYTWTQYDMVTHVPVPTVAPAPPATTAGFAAAHGGDGAGFYTIGFGCDGSAFHMDAWQIGGPGGTIRYDLEGLATTTDIAGSQQQVAPGEPVRLFGKLRLGRGDRMRAGTLMLESRPAAGGEFEVVEVVDAAASDPDVVVRPTESTVYRWRFAGRPMTEASQSALFVVTVLDQPDEPPEPPELPEIPDPDTDESPGDGDPTGSPSPTPSPPTAPTTSPAPPTQPPGDTPTEAPTETPTDGPTDGPGGSPTDGPGDQPSNEPSPS